MQNEEVIQENERTEAMVVTGIIDHLTDASVVIAFNGLDKGTTTITVNRPDFGAGGSVGIPTPDASPMRVWAFNQYECPTCENNNEGDNHRRWRVGEENKSCPTCKGKGKMDSLDGNTCTDNHHQELIDPMTQGEVPDEYKAQFEWMGKGNRDGRMDDWDAEITRQSALFLTPDGQAIPTLTNPDAAGIRHPTIIQHFNPQYASESMPHGYPIGRPKTNYYATKTDGESHQHSDFFIPIMKVLEENGIPFTAWGANHGQDAYLDIILSQNGTQEEVFATLRKMKADGVPGDYGYSGENSIKNNPAGLIKFGIQFHHSFDGAFTMRSIGQRVVCLNGIVATSGEELLWMQHKGNIMQIVEENMDKLARAMIAEALALWNEMTFVEGMNNIPIGDLQYEQICVLAEQRGLITYPGVGANNQLTGGREIRAMNQGWENPNEDWVAVGATETHPTHNGQPYSLYHLYNLLTGVKTHQIEANDVHGRVTGGKATSITRVQNQLQATHQLCRDIQNDAFKAFTDVNGREPSNAQDLAEWVANTEGSIPMLAEAEAPTVVKYDDKKNVIWTREAVEGRGLPQITYGEGTDNERRVQLTCQHQPAGV